MKYVLDASAFLNKESISLEGEFATTNEVNKEIKDFRSRALLSSIDIQIMEPEKSQVERATSAAKRTGDFPALSIADISVIALALQEKCTLVSDDYDVQNVCGELGIMFIPASLGKIRKKFSKGMYCFKCRKFRKGIECSACGAKLRARVVDVEDIRNTH